MQRREPAQQRSCLISYASYFQPEPSSATMRLVAQIHATTPNEVNTLHAISGMKPAQLKWLREIEAAPVTCTATPQAIPKPAPPALGAFRQPRQKRSLLPGTSNHPPRPFARRLPVRGHNPLDSETAPGHNVMKGVEALRVKDEAPRQPDGPYCARAGHLPAEPAQDRAPRQPERSAEPMPPQQPLKPSEHCPNFAGRRLKRKADPPPGRV